MKKIILGRKNDEEKLEVNQESQDRIEDTSKRSAYAKHYKNNDGTFTMELNSEPIHFLNQATKEYEEIDNTFTEEERELKLVRNEFKLEFNKEMEEHKILRLHKNNREVSLRYRGKEEQDSRCICHKSRAKTRNEGKLVNSVVYEEIAPNIDLEYIISHNRVKENIVIKQKQETYKFTFELNISNYEIQLSNDKQNIELVDQKGQVQIVIPSPVMKDASGEISHEVTYDLVEEDEGVFVLIVTADKEWINDEGRVLPVKIDPQFIDVSLGNDELEQYLILDDIATRVYDEGYLKTPRISTKDRIMHAVTFYQDKLSSLEFISASLVVRTPVLPIVPITVGIYQTSITKNTKLETFRYEENKYSHIGTLEENEFLVLCNSLPADVFKDNKENLKKDVTLILRLMYDHRNPTVKISGVSLIIQYKIKPFSPSHYLEMGRRVMTEIVSPIEIGLEEIEEVENGVLTTIVDSSNKKVYQNYQVKTQVLVRESATESTWGYWKALGLNAIFDCGVLYLEGK